MARAFTDDVVITVDDAGVRDVLFRLEIATLSVGMEMWANIAVDPWLQRRARQRFISQGDSASGRWKPLTELTKEWRVMQGYSEDPINIRSGALMEWLLFDADGTWMSQGAGAGTYYWPGVHLPYDDYITAKLKVAQVGSALGENPLFPNSITPPRPVVKIDSVDALGLLTSYHDFIEAYVGDTAASITASGTFGGKTFGAPSRVTAMFKSVTGGTFS